MTYPHPRGRVICALALTAMALLAPSALAAGPPQVKSTTFSAVTDTSATLEAKVNPGNVKVPVNHFEYVDQASFEASGFATAKSTPDGSPLPAVNTEVAFSASIAGLTPGTAYRFRVVVENSKKEKTVGPEATLFTFAPPPAFGSCPNEELRSGSLAPPGHPSDLLPDCRAYEQASPVDKDGGDLLGEPQFSKAAADGSAIAFGSTFGVPGGIGATNFPFYLASRGGDGSWLTHGLLPPPSAGEKAQFLVGWTPDFAQTFAVATKLGNPRTEALYELHRNGAPPTQMTPYSHITPPFFAGIFYYAGASEDASTVVFESLAKLPPAEGEAPIPAARENDFNVYAWDAQSGRISLVSVMNSEAETEALRPEGAFAGPYHWMQDELHQGGAHRLYYLQAEHAVSSDGSVFFTAGGTGQLYKRLNPTQPQSSLDPEGHCTEPAKACTVHVSPTDRTPADPAGTRPAAFQAASADGSKAFFTSSEELTDDANTGPVQPPAQIGRAKLDGEGKLLEVEEGFLPAHALGIATDPAGEYIYWTEPIKGTIGRAKLGASGPELVNPEFIVPGPTEFERDPVGKPGVTEEVPPSPQYVAVDSEYVYWTNTGPLNEFGNTIDGAGTVGRAKLGPSGPVEVDPAFITGVSDPQGIAVDSEHLFWTDVRFTVGGWRLYRSAPNGSGVTLLREYPAGERPSGIALDGEQHLYISASFPNDAIGSLERISSSDGHSEKGLGFSDATGFRGIAVGDFVYWASQAGERGEAIGRIDRDLETDEKCPSGFPPPQDKVRCIRFFRPPGKAFGLAVSGEYLYWSINGESPPNPGNDLYRREVNGGLEDLTPDSTDVNGADVQGVLGVSDDGSYVYFAANGDLDGAGPASVGDCKGPPSIHWNGSCSLYVWHEGEIEFVARLGLAGSTTDAYDWAQTPFELISTSDYVPKTSFVTPDGRALLFFSHEDLTSYDSHGQPEFYLHRAGEPLVCVTCNPSGQAPSAPPTLNTTGYPGVGLLARESSSVLSRYLSADGSKAFFETSEALVASDTDVGCGPEPAVCKDVYEWEAPGSGSCSVGGPGYSPQNRGCIYLISTGRDPYPSFLLDASASGSDVFLLTRSALVGQDGDLIQDVYDARVDGGLVSQNQPPRQSCEGEGCKPGVTPVPSFSGPSQFSGPPNPKRRNPACRKGKKRAAQRCAHKHKKKRHRGAAKHRHGGNK